MIKRFKYQDMTWKKVIIFAIISAVYTAVVNLVPIFQNTSFSDIAVNIECWILFAVFIIINCNSAKEAAAKTFVFFLISQPLIYLIEVPFSSMGFGLFGYYERWFKITLLTIPGAAIAFQIKKNNWLSVAVLSVATSLLGFMAADYFWRLKANFPYHLLSFFFCCGLTLFLSICLFEKRIFRFMPCMIFLIVAGISLFVFRPNTTEYISLAAGEWSYVLEDPSIAKVDMNHSNGIQIKAKKDGTSYITFTDESGNKHEYLITVVNGSVLINSFNE